MPRTIGGNSGFVMSGTSTPTVNERLVFRPRAIGLGRYPSSSAARMTRSAVASLTSPRVSTFSARETVPGWTRAARAISPTRDSTDALADDANVSCLQSFVRVERRTRRIPLPNINYFPVERLEDTELRGYVEHAARYGTP